MKKTDREEVPARTAVALRYDGEGAPRVTAKRRGELAGEILKRAREHGIPLYEDAELAAALARIRLGEEIPAALYRACAVVIAFTWGVERSRTALKNQRRVEIAILAPAARANRVRSHGEGTLSDTPHGATAGSAGHTIAPGALGLGKRQVGAMAERLRRIFGREGRQSDARGQAQPRAPAGVRNSSASTARRRRSATRRAPASGVLLRISMNSSPP